MVAAAYAAYKDPKGAGVLVLCLGVFFLIAGLWGAIESKGLLGWLLIGLGGPLVVVGWLFAFAVHWDLGEK